jgi:hypothetical protein
MKSVCLIEVFWSGLISSSSNQWVESLKSAFFVYGFNIVGSRGKDKIITINVFSAFLTLFRAIDKEVFFG